jgi:DNA-binding ferritin-like protein
MATRKNNNNSKMVITFLDFLMLIKLYHWNTHSYANHKATDELFSSISGHIDSFVEILLGGSRLPLFKIKTYYYNLNSKDFNKKVIVFQQYLMNLSLKRTELSNIKDEILGDVNQFIYLNSLQ